MLKPKAERVVSTKSYASSEKPLSLSQMQHIAPKKFKSKQERPQVNLGDLRQAIEKAKESGDKQQ